MPSVGLDGFPLTFDDGEGVLHASNGYGPVCRAWFNNGLRGPRPGIVSCLFCLCGDDYPNAIGDGPLYFNDSDDDEYDGPEYGDGAYAEDVVDYEQSNRVMDDLREKIGP